MTKLVSRGVLALMMMCVASGAVLAQKDKDDSLACRDNWQNGKLVSHCEIMNKLYPQPEGLSRSTVG